MIEIRFHGRGGQGAVTAAEILAKAAFKDGKYSQAFPFFGVERRGAPVMAFTRIDDKPIDIRYQLDIYCRYLKEADALSRSLIFNIINHPTLEVVIPYNNINLTHNANIRITADVEDNSGIPERLVPGQFTRLTLTLTLDDAYLWDARPRDNIYVELSDISVSEDIINN